MESGAFNAGSVLMHVVSCLAIVANVLVVAVFARTRQLRIKYYGFVFNLVLSDIALPTVSIVYEHVQDKLVLALIWTTLYASAFNILAVAVNRLLALCVTPPARYDVIVTRRRLLAVCSSIWLVSVLVFVPTTYVESLTFSRLIRPLILLAILIITGVLYSVVFLKIARYSAPLAATDGVTPADEQAQRGTRVRQIRHLMVTFAIIFVVACVCWIPSCIANFVIYYHGEKTPVLWLYLYYSYIIAVINSAVNPFIYWGRISEGRRGFYRLICCGRETDSEKGDSVDMETVEEMAK